MDTVVDSELVSIRPLMSTFPTGVSIVTAVGPNARPRGMTCTSLCSAAAAPPTLLVSLRSASPTLDAALLRGRFALNLLNAEARWVAELYASGEPDRFERVSWHLPDRCAGPHLLDVAHMVADCRVTRTEPVGDHTVLFAEIYRTTRCTDGPPLLYGLRRYAIWPDEPAR